MIPVLARVFLSLEVILNEKVMYLLIDNLKNVLLFNSLWNELILNLWKSGKPFY